MKLPNWFKVTWWIVLLAVTSYILIMRLEDITAGSSLLFDVFIFLIWIVLMLAPIFTEINVFGLKLKQEIEDLKKTIVGQITDFKSEISNRINVSPIINFTPAKDSEVLELEERYKKKLDEQLRVQGKNKLEDDQIKNVPELNMYLFSVRYKIEIEIRKIWENSIGNHNLKKKTPLFQMLRELFANDYIDINLYEPHKEILSITSLGIHGEKISDIQSSFVKDIAPRLIATLEEKK